MKNPYYRNLPLNVSTLTISAQPGLTLKIEAKSVLSKKARRTALLLLLKAVKRELEFIRGASLFHDDSTLLRRFEDSMKEASTYQATAITTSNERFGHQIRMLRTGAGLTQNQLADICGLRREYLCLVERGQRTLSEKNKKRLSEVLEFLYIGKDVVSEPKNKVFH